MRGLFDGLTGTLLRQMTYSMMRFAVYDEAKKAVHVGKYLPFPVSTTLSGRPLRSLLTTRPRTRSGIQDGTGRKHRRRSGWCPG